MAAQSEDLTTEIDVERSVEVQLPPATALPSMMPATLPVSAPDVPLKPAYYSEATDYTPLAGYCDPDLYTGLNAVSRRRGYLWAGYFPAYNLGVAAGYRIIDTENTSMGASLRFNGYSYHTPTGRRYDLPQAGSKYSASDNTGAIQAYASHRLNSRTMLRCSADYFHAALRSADFSGTKQTRGIDAFNIALNIAGSDTVSYAATVRYSRFGLDKGKQIGFSELPSASDDRFTADIKAGLNFGHDRRQHIGLDVSFDLLHRHGLQAQEFELVDVSHKSTGILSLTPVYTIRSHHFLVRTGVKIDIGINSEDKVLHIAPDVTMAWMPSAHFAAYTTFTGGERFRTLRDQYDYSPFAPFSTASSRSYTPVEARVGFNVRPFKPLTLDLFAGYGSTRRMPMLVVSQDRTTFAPTDLSGWNFGINAAYSYGKYLQLNASARLYPHSYSSGSPEAPDRARLTVNAQAKVKPTDALTIDLEYRLRAGREYYILYRLDDNTSSVMRNSCPTGNISDLALGGTYTFTPTFSVFLRLENLLCRRTMILPNLYSRRLHGLAGISIRF